MGNDAALLDLAVIAPSVEYKLSLIQALATEDGLRKAEREFRKHDRRVHSLAKQRYERLVKQRETRSSASELIQTSAELVEAPIIPSNRLAELKRTWELLDQDLIEDGNKSRFYTLQASLEELVRERGELKRSVTRWKASAQQILADLNSACAGATAYGAEPGEAASALGSSAANARSALLDMPPTSPPDSPEAGAVDGLVSAIHSALNNSDLIAAKLSILSELQSAKALLNAPLNEENVNPHTAAIAAAAERWQALPPVAGHQFESMLNARLDEYMRLRSDALKKLQKQNSLAESENKRSAQQSRIQILTAAANAMESALGSGNLADAENHLAILQTETGKAGAGNNLQARINALQSEFSRLKGWQHWGGGRVRDDIVLEAEALAATTLAPEGGRPVKLPVKQLEKNIEQLRTRWKELDRLGAATNKSLWQRFESALKTAYLPVAALQAQLKEARQENLNARRKLLDTLESINISAGEQESPDWKEAGRALQHFQTDWRKLGPVEHTVPHKSLAALLERMKTGVERLEAPLKEAQSKARTEREQLIARTKALGQNARGKEMLAKLRELQSLWQSHAKSHPLPRKIENLLWAEFKAASDALMSLREAEMSARDAELKAAQSRREALIALLEALHQDTPPADIKQTLASADTEWRKAGEAPKNQADKLESRYQAARKQALGHVTGNARRSWHRTCDTLLSKLALCEERESPTPPADIEARWDSLAPLPPLWEQALGGRYRSATNPDEPNPEKNSSELLDQTLLQLESALEIPSPEAFQMARRTLKLQAMKNALEGRRQSAPAFTDIEKMTAEALGRTQPGREQRSRLQNIIAALRNLDSAQLKSAPAA